MLVLYLTRVKVVDSHVILLASPDAERLPVKVDGVDVLGAAHVQEVPSDPLLLSHHQPGQRVPHVAVDGWGRQWSGAAGSQGASRPRVFPSRYRLWDGKGKGKVLTMEGMVSPKVRVVQLDAARWAAVPLHVLPEVPALGLVKNGEEQGELLHSQLPSGNSVHHVLATDDERPDEARVQVLLLPGSQERSWSRM